MFYYFIVLLFIYLIIPSRKILFSFLDTDDCFDARPRDIVDIFKKSVDVDENMKMQITNNRMSRANS